jgi:hypothetical protein
MGNILANMTQVSNVAPGPLVCLFVLSAQQFFSYLTAVTITGDRAANLDLCSAFSSDDSFTCHTLLLRLRTSVFKIMFERPMILISECRALGIPEQSLPILQSWV